MHRMALTTDVQVTLLRRVLAELSLSPLGPHGLRHWARVLETGRRLADRAGQPRAVVEAFALLHDSKREREHDDPQHGARAAAFAQQLADEGALQLDDVGLCTLEHACRLHSDGLMTADPITAICWDADRLDLGRVGLRPRREWLCSDAARDADLFNWAVARGESRVVPDLVRLEWGLAIVDGALVQAAIDSDPR